jgi:putative ABC transport system permease protein
MSLLAFGVKNVLRNRLRTLMTLAAVAVAILAFLFLRTILDAWTAASEHAATDRVATRHKVTLVMPLPLHYVEEIRQVPGVKAVALASWFGGKDPQREDQFFASIAVRPASLLEVYDEIQVPPEQRRSWIENRRGALIGDALAKQFGWKVGDRVILRGTIYTGDWEFQISGIYTATRRSIDRMTFFFHWDYLSEQGPSWAKDQVGWVISRIDDPSRSAEISRAIDQRFEDRDIQTLSMSERALNASFLGMLSAVLQAVDMVSVVILIIMMLILGNTIAMGVRERTHEYGVLRAVGFMPRHIAGLVLAEAMATGGLGGLLGLLLAYPLIERGMGRFMEENMGAFFPFVRINPATGALAVVLAVGLALVAAAIPAYRASRLKVVDTLRQVG